MLQSELRDLFQFLSAGSGIVLRDFVRCFVSIIRLARDRGRGLCLGLSSTRKLGERRHMWIDRRLGLTFFSARVKRFSYLAIGLPSSLRRASYALSQSESTAADAAATACCFFRPALLDGSFLLRGVYCLRRCELLWDSVLQD